MWQGLLALMGSRAESVAGEQERVEWVSAWECLSGGE